MGNLVYISDVTYNRNTVLTVGTFDGVHRGHRTIIDKVVEKAKSRGARSVVVTFDPHPRDILNPSNDGIKLLTTLHERAEILSDLGIDQLVVIPFTRDFSLLTSEEFIHDIIYQKIGVEEFVIGYDHQFGRDRKGSIDTLRKMAEEHQFDVDVVEAHEIESVTISSTLVRRQLEREGNIMIARNYLGRPYQLTGTVVHGNKRGRLIGFPTANINPDNDHKIVPHNGVYAVEVRIDNREELLRGMMNIGVRPTFTNEMNRVLEVHIIDFNEDLYGKSITVHFLKRIREEMAFNGIDAIREQLELDRESCLSV